LRTVRDIAVGLRPSVLDLGLGPALQWQARYFSRNSDVTVTATVGDKLPPLPDTHLTCVYRIVQEALTNSARHSQATQVDVTVSAQDGLLEVIVRDNGIGFKEDWMKQRGLGLIGIEERARELGGTLSIDSGNDRGARIQVNLPIPKEVQDEENTRAAR
jgi:signal transduction histidine kinase